MKTKPLISGVVIFLTMACLGDQIIFFTDKPNSVPVDSDFFILQRNRDYINSSAQQVRTFFFQSPSFTGNGYIPGQWHVGPGGIWNEGIYYGNGIGLTNINATGTNASFTFITNFTLYSTNIVVQNITNNTLITTNVTIEFPGGFTNLNLTPKTVMYADINDAESSIPNAIGVLTNDGVGGIGFSSTMQLDELDVQNAYLTNLFTGKTNFLVLATDGNGLLANGAPLAGTNLLLSAGANITFTTNGSGGISIASSGTNSVSTITNNLFVTTNIIVYDSVTIQTNLTVNQNIFASTNFSTNLYFLSGKGNTLIISNNVNLDYLAVSKLVATDGAKNLTNANVSARFTFTGNVLDIASGSIPNADLANSSITIQNAAVALGGSTLAQGSKPVFDLQSSTNLLLSSVSSPTNGISTASSIDFTLPEAVTNIAGAVSQTSLANFNQTNINHAIRYYVNRTGSDQTITVGTWETDSGRTTATTYTCTNNTTLALMFSAYIGQFTNVTSYKTFR